MTKGLRMIRLLLLLLLFLVLYSAKEEEPVLKPAKEPAKEPIKVPAKLKKVVEPEVEPKVEPEEEAVEAEAAKTSIKEAEATKKSPPDAPPVEGTAVVDSEAVGPAVVDSEAVEKEVEGGESPTTAIEVEDFVVSGGEKTEIHDTVDVINAELAAEETVAAMAGTRAWRNFKKFRILPGVIDEDVAWDNLKSFIREVNAAVSLISWKAQQLALPCIYIVICRAISGSYFSFSKTVIFSHRSSLT